MLPTHHEEAEALKSNSVCCLSKNVRPVICRLNFCYFHSCLMRLRALAVVAAVSSGDTLRCLARFMRAIGLPGKAFVPLIVGFGCNVPAVMATRTRILSVIEAIRK